jgi:diguanylate cyclase (GGDEF)-like protein
VFVDLDDFKDVNDTYGHAEGDDVLRMAAARMRRCTRPGDVLARLGGDEFAVLLEGHDARVAEDLAQRIIQAMDAPFVVAGQATRVTASVGVAIGTSTDTDGFELLRFADMAMYEAKLRGKGRFAVFDAALGEAHVLRTRGGQELRQGIERDELVLHYQPIVDLTSGDVVGLEALVRWQHPRRGLLQPDEFVALAERTGAIDALGRWVLHTACEQHSAWRATRTADRPLQMSVNVSTHQLDDPTFALTVAEVLASTDLEPSSLCLDITESAVLADPVQAQKTVEDLRQLGVELAIDDFGTGYASLTTLRRLHASGVKIDRTFIGSLGDDDEDLHIVAAVIGLARAMGLSVTAEGVETPEQLALLRDLGCQQAQGFHLGRPVPADELSDQLRHRWVDLRS